MMLCVFLLMGVVVELILLKVVRWLRCRWVCFILVGLSGVFGLR